MRCASALAVAAAMLTLWGAGDRGIEGHAPQAQPRQTPPQPKGAGSDDPRIQRVRYLALARDYCTGADGDQVGDLSTWSHQDFAGIHSHMSRYRDWQAHDVECAAMLHTEAALRETGWSPALLSHLKAARRLLWLLAGEPLDQSFRREWCVALAAFFHGTLQFAEWEEHLTDALRAFPDDGDLLLALGMEQEAMAAPVPRMHLFTQSLRVKASGEIHELREDLPSGEEALLRAGQSYRRALARVPGLLEARLRLGRVLIAGGQPDAGLKELATVLAESTDSRLTYLASLFAGRAIEARSQLPEAAGAYRKATSLYPACQTAWLALSHTALGLGDRAEAERLVRHALDQPAEDCDDPRWTYDLGLAPQADAMVEQLRQRIRRP